MLCASYAVQEKNVFISCFLQMIMKSEILLLHILSNGRFHPNNNDFFLNLLNFFHEVQLLLIMYSVVLSNTKLW